MMVVFFFPEVKKMKKQLLLAVVFLIAFLAPCIVDMQTNTTHVVSSHDVLSCQNDVLQEAQEESCNDGVISVTRGRMVAKIKVATMEEKEATYDREERPDLQSKFKTHFYYAREAGGIPNIRWLS